MNIGLVVEVMFTLTLANPNQPVSNNLENSSTMPIGIDGDSQVQVDFTLSKGNIVRCLGVLLFLQNQLIIEPGCLDSIDSDQLLAIQLRIDPSSQNAVERFQGTNSHFTKAPQATFTDAGGSLFHCDGVWLPKNVFLIDQNCVGNIEPRQFRMIQLELQPELPLFIRFIV